MHFSTFSIIMTLCIKYWLSTVSIKIECFSSKFLDLKFGMIEEKTLFLELLLNKGHVLFNLEKIAINTGKLHLNTAMTASNSILSFHSFTFFSNYCPWKKFFKRTNHSHFIRSTIILGCFQDQQLFNVFASFSVKDAMTCRRFY